MKTTNAQLTTSEEVNQTFPKGGFLDATVLGFIQMMYTIICWLPIRIGLEKSTWIPKEIISFVDAWPITLSAGVFAIGFIFARLGRSLMLTTMLASAMMIIAICKMAF